MAYDIYGNVLRRGYCEVHPDIPEEWPCAVCMENSSRLSREEQAYREYYEQQGREYYEELYRQQCEDEARYYQYLERLSKIKAWCFRISLCGMLYLSIVLSIIK